MDRIPQELQPLFEAYARFTGASTRELYVAALTAFAKLAMPRTTDAVGRAFKDAHGDLLAPVLKARNTRLRKVQRDRKMAKVAR